MSHEFNIQRVASYKHTYFSFILQFLAQTSKLLTDQITSQKKILNPDYSFSQVTLEMKGQAHCIVGYTILHSVLCCVPHILAGMFRGLLVLHEYRTQYTSHTNADGPDISPEGPSNACSLTLTCVCSQIPDPSHHLLRHHEKTRLNQSAPSTAHKLTASVN